MSRYVLNSILPAKETRFKKHAKIFEKRLNYFSRRLHHRKSMIGFAKRYT